MNPFLGNRPTGRYNFENMSSFDDGFGRPSQASFLSQSQPASLRSAAPASPETPQPLMAQVPFPARGRNVQQNAARELNFAQNMSRKLVFLYIAWAVLELAGTTTVLIYSKDKPCRQPLNLWVGIHSARQLYYLPQYFKRLRGIPESSDEMRRKSWLHLLQFTWFIVGQSWFFEAETCRRTSPELYYWVMSMVIATYLVMLAPLLLLLGLCFCLPCVLVLLRFITPNPGAQQEDIVQLPERNFDPNRYRRGVPNEEVEAELVSPIAQMEQGRRGDKQDGTEPRPVQVEASPRAGAEVAASAPTRDELGPEVSRGARPTPSATTPSRPTRPAASAEVPNCAICMDDFVTGDRLRSLPCQHDFHKDCVDRWLAVNSTCPVCRNSIFHTPDVHWNAPVYG